MININGLQIFVEKIQGNGDLNFVLIHNAGGNHQFFTHQIDTLKNYGTIIQIDLPGHGKSNPISNLQINDVSSLIAQICEHLSLKNICFIGLNYGANLIIETILNHSLPLKSIILIDPPIFMETSFKNEINNFVQHLESPNFTKFITKLVDSLFIETDPCNKKIAQEAFQEVDKKSLQDIFRGLIEWDGHSSGKMKKISCPILCILTDEHHCSYKKLYEEAPHIEIGKVIGSKCWATLEVPDQINAMIERFVKIQTESRSYDLKRK